MGFDKELQKALEADGEYLRQMTGEDHGPYFLDAEDNCETLYVLIKRDLYECPEHQGYTGIKDLAGAWPLSLVRSETVPVKDKYDRRDHGHYALPVDLAPDFTNACFHDLAQAHLQKKIDAKDAEIEQLKAALVRLESAASNFYDSATTYFSDTTFDADGVLANAHAELSVVALPDARSVIKELSDAP